MLKRGILCLSMAMLVGSWAVGCSTEPSQLSEATSGVEPASEETYSQDEIDSAEAEGGQESEVEAEGEGSLSVSDITGTTWFYRLNEDGSRVDDFYVEADDLDCGVYLLRGDPAIIDRSKGERLIFTGEAQMNLTVVASQGFCQDRDVSIDIEDYEEIDGVSVSGFSTEEELAFFSERGVERVEHRGAQSTTVLLQSPSPITFSAGWYEGTTWHEGGLPLIIPYYERGSEHFSVGGYEGGSGWEKIEAIKTKNGYFEVDLSKLEVNQAYILGFYPEAESPYGCYYTVIGIV